ncbi:hypothetical protein GGH20_002703, partial [Coemansia sp. RSA 1937]
RAASPALCSILTCTTMCGSKMTFGWKKTIRMRAKCVSVRGMKEISIFSRLIGGRRLIRRRRMDRIRFATLSKAHQNGHG